MNRGITYDFPFINIRKVPMGSVENRGRSPRSVTVLGGPYK